MDLFAFSRLYRRRFCRRLCRSKSRITNAIISIREGLSYQFEALFFDESGREVNNPNLEWSAIPPTAVEIQSDGTLKALETGNVLLTVSTIGLQGDTIEASFSFEITPKVVSEVTTTTTEVSSSTTDNGTSPCINLCI